MALACSHLDPAKQLELLEKALVASNAASMLVQLNCLGQIMAASKGKGDGDDEVGDYDEGGGEHYLDEGSAGIELVSELFATAADQWKGIFPGHFVKLIGPMDEEASALLQRELPAYFAKWRGLDMLFGYAAMHAQNSTVLSHLRTLAERLANVNNATLADRYLHGDDDDDGGGDYSGGTSTHLSAVFSCEGHADLCERWSSGVASESFVDFQAHAADISGGDVADDSGARSATSPIRDRLCIVLLVDGHVKDAASRLPLCCIELGHASTTTTSPAASSITLQAAPTANPAVVGTAAADRWKAATMKVQRHAKTAAAFAVSHTLDIMLRNLLQLEAAGGCSECGRNSSWFSETHMDHVVGDVKVSCRHYCETFAAAESD